MRTDASLLIGWRCIHCRATPYHNATFITIKNIYNDNLSKLSGRTVYELSAHGAIFNAFIKYSTRVGFKFVYSEFFENCIPGGNSYNDIRCEDVQALSFPDNNFDLITSSSVFEHVEDDIAGFKEIARTLKSQGLHIFTVPYTDMYKTVIRARKLENGQIEHFETPEYHSDPYRGEGGVFTWRNYGHDLATRTSSAGMETETRYIKIPDLDGVSVPVFVSRKSGIKNP